MTENVNKYLSSKYSVTYIRDLYTCFIKQQPRGTFNNQVIPLLDFSTEDIQSIIQITVGNVNPFPSKKLIRFLLYPEKEGKITYIPKTLEFPIYLEKHIFLSLQLYLVSILTKVMSEELENLLIKIIQEPKEFIKLPEFTGNSISFSIDDSSLYSIEYDNQIQTSPKITLSFYPYRFHDLQLRTPHRFYKLVNLGYIPKRGTITYRKKKTFLSIPFEKYHGKPKTKKEIPLICGVDLGIKTFATLSICQDGTECHRKFLDQKHLIGTKDRWFRTNFSKSDFVNFKGKLVSVHRMIREIQSAIATETSRDQVKWLKKEYNRLWKKISNIHQELTRQIATRIVTYAKYYKASIIRLEDLSWAQHGSKYKVGYFLTTLQVHWFHGQVRKLVEDIAKREEIGVEIVTPRYSSKLCSRCGVKGRRKGKHFSCEECGLRLNSDLNAARNLAKPNWEDLSSRAGRKLVKEDSLLKWF